MGISSVELSVLKIEVTSNVELGIPESHCHMRQA